MRVFVDTSFYVAAINEHDTAHSRAAAFSQTYSGTLLTTEYVLVELGNWFARSVNRSQLGSLVDRILTDGKTLVIPAERVLLLEGIRLYTERSDKQWSLTDTISFIVMSRYGISDALTADHHFEQAGFRPLLV